MFRSFSTIALLSLTISAARAQEAPAQIYINKGNVTNVQVNAVNFVNEGRFAITSILPWDPQNTVNFTNRGTMSGSVGFRFETVDSGFGFRHQASTFYNAPNAKIQSSDGFGTLLFTSSGFVGGTFTPDASLLTINAAAVTNRGGLSVGPNGIMKVLGGDVDLTGGSLIVDDNATSGNFFGIGLFPGDITETNFFPATGVYDLAYGVSINTNMPTTGIIAGINPNQINTPIFTITNSDNGRFLPFGQSCQINLANAQVWVRDEFVTSSNRVIQVIAVDTVVSNINVSASFYSFTFPNGGVNGGFLSPLVEFQVPSTNFVTLGLQTNSLYVFDQLASGTNATLITNLVAGTVRPAPIALFRSGPGLGDLGQPPSTRTLQPDLFDSPAYSNRFVTNQYAVYSAEIQSVASRLPALPDVGITNLPGQIQINARNLKMDNTRIRGEGLVTINATNFTSGQGSVIDTPRITLNMTRTAGVLDLKDMTPDSIERFGGFLQVFAGAWTNNYGVITGAGTTNAATNNIEVDIELLAINGDDLHTRESVLANELRLGSPGSVIYEDNLSVSNVLQITTPSFTLADGSRLYLSKGIGFSYTNILNVSTFTNLGTLQVNELAELKRDEATPYDVFVNRGTILAFGTEITANYFESTGDIISSNYYTLSDSTFFADCFGRPTATTISEATEGAITIDAATAKIDAGTFSTAGDVQFRGSVFKINHHQASAGGRMVLDVSDVLTDSGEDAGNTWQTSNGFAMGASHPGGDLLGSELRTVADDLSFVDNIWSAEDRGATVAGFTDNVAIGRLVIRGGTGSRFQFLPGAPNSALYADVIQIDGLEASSLTEFTNRVQLGMNVYYGNIETTNGVLTAERLNRILGPNSLYNFIWVPEWAGPNSGVDVPLTENGPVRRFNRALRESPNIDSDGDGLPNLYDPFPFPPQAFGITGITLNQSSRAISFGFTAVSSGTYIVEYSTNLATANWQPLTQILQSNPSGGILSYTDESREGDPQRYYRVRKAP